MSDLQKFKSCTIYWCMRCFLLAGDMRALCKFTATTYLRHNVLNSMTAAKNTMHSNFNTEFEYHHNAPKCSIMCPNFNTPATWTLSNFSSVVFFQAGVRVWQVMESMETSSEQAKFHTHLAQYHVREDIMSFLNQYIQNMCSTTEWLLVVAK